MLNEQQNEQNKEPETELPEEKPSEPTTPVEEPAEDGLPESVPFSEGAASSGSEGTAPAGKRKHKKDPTLAIVLAVLAVFALIFCLLVSGALIMIAQLVSNVKENPGDFYESSQIVSEYPEDSRLPGQSNTPSDGGETPRYENSYDINSWVKAEDLNDEQPVVNVATKCTPSVVTVRTDGGSGSGVIWTTDGYIVTNNHVIEGYKNAVVTLVNGAKYPATVIDADSSNDLALLRISVTGLLPADLRADENEIKVGETVVVIGNPLGTLANSVSKGIVSALNRKITVEGTEMTLTQIDASVNPGNSGGGCFDIYGRLIGIVNAKSVDEDLEGLGYAIPLSTVKRVITGMMQNDKTEVRKSLGITGVFVNEENYAELKAEGLSDLLSAYEEKNGSPVYGVIVTDDKQTVYVNQNNSFKTGTGSMTAQNRIQYVYDTIVSIDGTAITSADQLNKLLSEEYKAEDDIEVEVYRIALNYSSGFFGQAGYVGCSDIEKLTIEIKVVEMYR